MNLIGQNPQAWLPYINEDALLRRLLESFRPHIHDIEDIVSDPATAEAKKVAMTQQENLPHLIGLIPQLLQQMQQGQPQQAQLDPNNVADAGLRLQEMQHEKDMQQAEGQQQQAAAQAQQQQAAQEHAQQMQQMLMQAKIANAQAAQENAAANVQNSQKR